MSENITFGRNRPAPIGPSFPIALKQMVNQAEKRLSGTGPYISREHNRAIYRSIDPFFAYESLHYLTNQRNLSPILKCAKKVMEAGCGLAIISFSVSQFLPRAMITGLELDNTILARARRMGKQLDKGQLCYNVSNVRFVHGDIAAAGDLIRDQDIVFVYLPLFEGDYEVLLTVFSLLRPKALLVQFVNKYWFEGFEDLTDEEMDSKEIFVSQKL